MPGRAWGPNTWLWGTVAAAAFGWSVIAVIFAAVGPPTYVPHIFHSPHAEHLVAFYALAILGAAALPRTPILHLVAGLALLAAALAVARLFMPYHRRSTAEDLLADVAGALAAVAPIFIGRFRGLAAQREKRPETSEREGEDPGRA
jgi:hypothetical protein